MGGGKGEYTGTGSVRINCQYAKKPPAATHATTSMVIKAVLIICFIF
jgi:hypothetical protein